MDFQLPKTDFLQKQNSIMGDVKKANSYEIIVVNKMRNFDAQSK